MKEIKTSRGGINYLHTVIHQTVYRITKAVLWKIPHNNPENDEYCVKIGRYKKSKGPFDLSEETLESLEPKSELTLKGVEFQSFIEFLEKEYSPFSQDVEKFIPLDSEFNSETLDNLQEFFSHPEKQELIDFILGHDIIPDELFTAYNNLSRLRAVEEFEAMLKENLTEHDWQRWFENNSWVFGTEYVKILDERKIDTSNISDFLMEAYDGFLDIIEIKRPDDNLKFWSPTRDHDNLVPHQDLIKAITQASIYIHEVEREANSIKFLERVDGIKTIKPRCVLIFGRSNDWGDEKKEAYRILNANYQNLNIMTYDHVLNRAKRMVQ